MTRPPDLENSTISTLDESEKTFFLITAITCSLSKRYESRKSPNCVPVPSRKIQADNNEATNYSNISEKLTAKRIKVR